MDKRRASRAPDELSDELDDIEFAGDADLLSDLRAEAQKTVEGQVATLNDIDSKASKILRLNVLLIGVIVSVLSIASGSSGDPNSAAGGSFTNLYMQLGVASLVLSTGLAAITYTVSEQDIGLSSGNLTNLVRADFSYEEAQALLVKNYIVRINFNRSTNIRNIPLITSTIVFVVVGVAFLTLGVYEATVAEVPNRLFGAILILLAAIVGVSGLITQTRRAIRDLNKWR